MLEKTCANALRVPFVDAAVPRMSHDQNFMNLNLDYPRQALALFAAGEAAAIDASARITPLRQEQPQERLGERSRERDVPLRVERPDGRREALLFVLEEESAARRFDIHSLAHYRLDLAQLSETTRVVPVVIFLDAGHAAASDVAPRLVVRLRRGTSPGGAPPARVCLTVHYACANDTLRSAPVEPPWAGHRQPLPPTPS